KYRTSAPSPAFVSTRASVIDIHRRPVRVGKEGAHDVARRIEGQRMRAWLGSHGLKPSKRLGAEDFDESGITDSHVQASQRGIEEHDVRDPGDLLRGQDVARI